MVEMDNSFIAHSSLLVVGYGVTGKAVVQAGLDLRSRGQLQSITLYPGVVTDEQIEAELKDLHSLDIDVVLNTTHVQGTYDIAVVSPGISMHSELYTSAQAASKELMSEPEFAWRLSADPWIAITGTNGKTTTTSLTHHLLCEAGVPAQAVGNIGTPCITAVMEGQPCTYVAELSSYQLYSTVHFAPSQAALINITPDHLAWHRTHEAYVRAKEEIFAHMTSDGLAVLNVDDAQAARIAQELQHKDVRLGVVSVEAQQSDNPVRSLQQTYPHATAMGYLRHDGMLCCYFKGEHLEVCAAQDLQISGAHNMTNALIAMLLVADAGLNVHQIRTGLTSFTPLEHRLEPVATHRDVLYVNDSKATNTDAALQALTAFPNRKILLLVGGADKGSDLSDFAQQVVAHCKAAICFGAAKERFSEALSQAGRHEDITLAQCDTLRDAFLIANQLSAPGDCVILSPACASFDEFNSYEHRGSYFKELVHNLVCQEVTH